jgi:hypothetical protein
MLKHYKKNQLRVPARVALLAPFWLAVREKYINEAVLDRVQRYSDCIWLGIRPFTDGLGYPRIHISFHDKHQIYY